MNARKTLALLIVVAISATINLVMGTPQSEDFKLPSARENIYEGYNFIIDPVQGDTMTIFFLRPITIFPKFKFKNKKEEEFYQRTVYNVRKVLPYAKMIRETLIETYEYIETFETKKEREAYLKKMEKGLFEQYKPILKRLSKNQAKLLVKLIQRETNQTSYEIVRAFLGSFRAVFWQGFGKLFGVSLKGKFDPEHNRQDEIINRIATQIEQGSL